MLFNSFEYFFFLPSVVLLYFLLPYRWRNPFLLVVSYYFYMSWKWEFGLLILFTSLVNYIASIKIQYAKTINGRRLWLSLAVVASLSVLVYFKYANFFIQEATLFLSSLGIEVRQSYIKVILPVGISFFTFQALSYSIDVFKERISAEKNLVDFFLFVSFFPTLIAGPISRATTLLNQFKAEQHFSSDRLIEGAKLIIWGLFKKAVIADRLAVYVNHIYSSPDAFGGSTLLLATLFFMFQIYCDFSGYSDIAIGSAHILGFRLVQNFDLPYLASSIREFWKRWHMSLTSWFRDYIFLPVSFLLAGRIKHEKILFLKADLFIYIIASAITWLLTGLWHGASNTFVIWGLLQGFFLIIYQWQRTPMKRFLKKMGIKKQNNLLVIAKTLFTFGIIMISWVFFRADNLNDAGYILAHMFTGWNRMPYLGASTFETVLGLSLIVLLYTIQVLQYRGVISTYMSPSPIPRSLKWIGYTMLIIMIAMLGISSDQFIYFQF